MKIKKVFEYNSIDTYQKIESIPDEIKKFHISLIERDKLLKTLPDLRKPRDISGDTNNKGMARKGPSHWNSISKVMYGIGSNTIDINIYVDKDEWYYIKLTGKKYTKDRYWIIDRNRFKCYKCDQFDGLIDCIKNEIIGKNED